MNETFHYLEEEIRKKLCDSVNFIMFNEENIRTEQGSTLLQITNSGHWHPSETSIRELLEPLIPGDYKITFSTRGDHTFTTVHIHMINWTEIKRDLINEDHI